MNSRSFFLSCIAVLIASAFSCSGEVEHNASAVNDADSLPFMNASGVNTLISDSGVMRYHMVAEEWQIYNKEGEAATWKFYKGLLMERFDEKFHVDLYVQADTAYLHQQYLWELRGRVVIRNINNEVFRTEELFWDMNMHEMWSHKYMWIDTPERQLEGTEFRSNEQMTKYFVSNSIGAFPVSDTESEETSDSTATQDTTHVRAASTQRFQPAPAKR